MSSEICVSPQNADFSAHVKIGQVAQIITNPNNNITATHIYLVPPSSSLNIQLLTVWVLFLIINCVVLLFVNTDAPVK